MNQNGSTLFGENTYTNGIPSETRPHPQFEDYTARPPPPTYEQASNSNNRSDSPRIDIQSSTAEESDWIKDLLSALISLTIITEESENLTTHNFYPIYRQETPNEELYEFVLYPPPYVSLAVRRSENTNICFHIPMRVPDLKKRANINVLIVLLLGIIFFMLFFTYFKCSVSIGATL